MIFANINHPPRMSFPIFQAKAGKGSSLTKKINLVNRELSIAIDVQHKCFRPHYLVSSRDQNLWICVS